MPVSADTPSSLATWIIREMPDTINSCGRMFVTLNQSTVGQFALAKVNCTACSNTDRRNELEP